MIEEPPQQTLFLLITHAPEKVLPTIASRCLSLRVLPPAQETVFDAEQMDLFADLMRALTERDLPAALETGEALSTLESREKQKSFCTFASRCLREIFLIQQGVGSLGNVPPAYRPFFEETASRCRKSFPRAALSHFDRAQLLLERNVSQRILFCDLVDRLYIAV
jgi:DNA polymerase-3 subunit delta'